LVALIAIAPLHKMYIDRLASSLPRGDRGGAVYELEVADTAQRMEVAFGNGALILAFTPGLPAGAEVRVASSAFPEQAMQWEAAAGGFVSTAPVQLRDRMPLEITILLDGREAWSGTRRIFAIVPR
jgi:hypothetical protein